METEKKVAPGLEERMRIFMKYWCPRFTFKEDPEYIVRRANGLVKGYYIEGYDVRLIAGKRQCLVSKCTLLLKSLSKISDDEADDLARLFKRNEFMERDKAIKFGRGVSSEFLKTKAGDATGEENIRMIDFLREREYAIPYKNWSVDELVEFGIFKLME